MPPGSSIHRIADADRPGNRIAIVKSHASAQPLNSLVKQAELVGNELPYDAFDLLRAGKADAFALPREQLIDFHQAWRLAGAGGCPWHQLRWMALGKGQPGRLAYISEFVEEAKASGLIQRIIDKGGLRGFQVSPPPRNHVAAAGHLDLRPIDGEPKKGGGVMEITTLYPRDSDDQRIQQVT